MGDVKTALEKALEKVKDIKGFSEEERLELKDRERIKTALASFLKGDITRDGLVEMLKGINRVVLVEAQKNLADTIRLNISDEDLIKKREVLVSLENVKGKGDIVAIEDALNVIKRIQKEYNDLREKTIQEVRVAIEQNPKLRVRPVRLPDGRMVQAALTVDEAVAERLTEFLDEHEKRYERMFTAAVERLKKDIK